MGITEERKKMILKVLEEVKDPEIPVISVIDLGIIREVEIGEDDGVNIYMTPTFVGCPALVMMRTQIKEKIESLDFENVNVIVDENNRWNSNLITEKGRKQLREFGLAPPPVHDGEITSGMIQKVACPYCGSSDTTLQSPFGSALCRAIHYCNNCLQSFEQFKPL